MTMTTMIRFAGTIFTCCLIMSAGWSYDCQDQNTGWEKVTGAKPANAFESLLYRNGAKGNNGIVAPCFDRCKTQNCTAFVIDFSRNICYSVQVKSEELVPESNATFFHKICIRVPPSCKRQRLWQVERTLGAILKDGHANMYHESFLRRSQCYEKCLQAGMCPQVEVQCVIGLIGFIGLIFTS